MMETQPMLGGNGFAVSRNLNPNLVRIETLKPLGRETRKHPPAQIRKLQASIEQFGFVLPIVVDATSRVIAGWGLALAAKKLGLPEVPAVTITDLDEPKLRMLRLGRLYPTLKSSSEFSDVMRPLSRPIVSSRDNDNVPSATEMCWITKAGFRS
jgi:ParB-like nuclease domain